MASERVLFVTGRLAEPALRRVVAELEAESRFQATIVVLNITVAALMHTEWIARHLKIDEPLDRAILPGWCQGNLESLAERFGIPFERGPKDLFDLPEFWGAAARTPPALDSYNIEILAEINHASRLSERDLMRSAYAYREQGADVIDLGCVPGESWSRVGDAVRQLRGEGFRVSIDSFERREVESAVAAGAELVLSGNSTNRDWLTPLAVEIVAIPDSPRDWASLEATVEHFAAAGTDFRIDPILEPIGFGFVDSLQRYLTARSQWPEREILMGIGNLTELSEVDSAGLNFLLAAICEERRIRSVLTTEVINWCRSAVREFDLARRVVKYALEHRALPKHFDSGLLMLRDAKLRDWEARDLADLAARITDPNIRVLAEQGELHLLNREGHWSGTDPFELFDRLRETETGRNLDSSHAFYLGYELCKAVTALTLGKQYRQDQALDWGFLTRPEISAHERRKQDRSE
jgi:dihydropteroate synthase-like protein